MDFRITYFKLVIEGEEACRDSRFYYAFCYNKQYVKDDSYRKVEII